ncbi:MAG: hypothetical protein R2712_12795 [Vicinamibacterales bacterium]
MLDERVATPRAGIGAIRFQLATAPTYDVAFYELEVIDDSSGAVLRRAYAHPWDWRHTAAPTFRFRLLAEPPASLWVRVVAAHPGVQPVLFSPRLRRGSVVTLRGVPRPSAHADPFATTYYRPQYLGPDHPGAAHRGRAAPRAATRSRC